jgi:DNA-directed RNA polymerase beta' subunit
MNYFNHNKVKINASYIAYIKKNINSKKSNKIKKYNSVSTNELNTEDKTYNFKKRLYTSYSKFTEVKLITIGIASPLRILQWAEKTLPNGKIYGEVLNANTLHHKTFKPQKGGLFCERIFGPLKDFECSCGKIDKTAKYSLRETEQKNVPKNETVENNIKHKEKSLGELTFGLTKDKSKTTRKLRKFCPDCDVEYTWSVVRRYQLGYIKLISPVTHIWFLKGTPSYLSILLDIKKRYLQSITYCSETFTIEHSESAASALQTYKISGLDLDSPSKIYALWLKAKSMETTSTETSESNQQIVGQENVPKSVKGIPYEFSQLSQSESPIYSNGIKKNNILDCKIKRINAINKWKKKADNLTIVRSAIQVNNTNESARERIFINKTSQLLAFIEENSKEFSSTFCQSRISARAQSDFDKNSQLDLSSSKGTYTHNGIDNTKKLNLYENILADVRSPDGLHTEFDIIYSEIRIYMLQLIYILQLGLIYNDLIQNVFSDKISNIETFLIQKTLYEKQGLMVGYLYEEIPVNTYSEEQSRALELCIQTSLISKINKKSPIDIYIKTNLQRMLYKKIIMHSIVKTWQNIYKKAYIKAMYKTISYFRYASSKSCESSNNKNLKNTSLNNFDLFFNYYKMYKKYASKTSIRYLKNIIQLVKSYFKKNVLLTLQNIKQPILSLNLKNTKKYTIKNISLKNTLYNRKYGLNSHMCFYYTNIPIPYSINQLINKKSEEMTDFLSCQNKPNKCSNLDSLVNLLAENGFMVPLVIGKYFEQTRYNILSKPENLIKNNITQYNQKLINTKENFLTKKLSKEDFLSINKHLDHSVEINTEFSTVPGYTHFIRGAKVKNNFSNLNLNYKRQLLTITKNLLKLEENQNNISFNTKTMRSFDGLRTPTFFNKNKIDSKLFSPFSMKPITNSSQFESLKFKIDFSYIKKLLPFRLLKQSYFDLNCINDGKYPSKKRNAYYYSINLPFLSATRELSKNNEFNSNKNRIISSENTQKKRLYNNVYTLSHRERWGSRVNEGKDWQIFLLYNTAASNYKDQPIFAYKDRISSTTFDSNRELSGFSKTIAREGTPSHSATDVILEDVITVHPGTGVNETRESVSNENLVRNPSAIKAGKRSYGVLINNSFFSGPGIIQQLLSELTFSEMKKLDKQNRLILYILNKSIFKLKKHIKIFFYDKTSQIEIRELCKKRDLLIRRTKLVRKLFRKDSDPSSMILTVLPVLPPDLRPIVKMGGQIAASDLNRFYQRVIYRNDRLKKFLKDPATSHSYEMKYAQRLLQEAVDNLIQNSQSSGEKDSRGRALKSLSDILKGKQGRFRQFLLGKRVDYSGRSVIVVGPKLKLNECGIPLEMALELYLPFLLKIILNKNYAKTVVGAKSLIKNNRPLAFELLREIMKVSPVLLNRAPTLHRLGFQAFIPKLVEGRAILLHPLVCSSFNADFDGDQMAVHVPITIESRAEAWKLMLSRNNMLSPATGDPLSIPSQDMVLGCYYLTTNSNKATLSLLRGSGFFFTDLQKVLYAYDLQQIDLHALVWVKWSGLIENGNDQEEPLEIRLSTIGHWQELSYNYIRHFDSSAQLINQYMSTTPGRILFYTLLQNL